jgi:hypothetical protein
MMFGGPLLAVLFCCSKRSGIFSGNSEYVFAHLCGSLISVGVYNGSDFELERSNITSEYSVVYVWKCICFVCIVSPGI